MKKLVTNSVYYVGANDHEIDLFEGQYRVPNGMCYNSYVILDDKICVMDTIDRHKTDEWLANVSEVLGGRKPDYLVVQHMEPDHCGSMKAFLDRYPDVTVVGQAKTFPMIRNFFHTIKLENTLTIKDGDTLELGHHTLHFVFAPMVHWPEVIMTYESESKILFTADAFGKFGALDREEDWTDEARRYYIGIVGKYGKQVQNVLKKAANLEIETICPLHGPVLSENLGYYLNLYDLWSGYRPEKDGVCVCYSSVYGNTASAVKLLVEQLKEEGTPLVKCFDLARCDLSEAVAWAFACDKLVLATTTYNGDIFPVMKTFLEHLLERNFQNRTVALIENGSWAPQAAKIMRKSLETCKDIQFAKNHITITSSVSKENSQQILELAQELSASYCAADTVVANKIDPSAMFKIGYGLYVVTTKDGDRDNGFICNTVTQLTDQPFRIAVNISKRNYSCETVAKTGVLNVCTLSKDAPFSLFQQFGFQSGRNVDKFDGCQNIHRTSNGLLCLTKYANAYISAKVISSIDLGTHTMFICDVTESAVLSDKETMTYNYYQSDVKPRPDSDKKGWVCNICGYIYEGEELPDDFICPLCKHGAADFSKL